MSRSKFDIGKEINQTEYLVTLIWHRNNALLIFEGGDLLGKNKVKVIKFSKKENTMTMQGEISEELKSIETCKDELENQEKWYKNSVSTNFIINISQYNYLISKIQEDKSKGLTFNYRIGSKNPNDFTSLEWALQKLKVVDINFSPSSDRNNGNVSRIVPSYGSFFEHSNSENILFRAVFANNSAEVEKALAIKDIDINAKIAWKTMSITKIGYTALMLAAENGNKEIVSLLIENGADPDLEISLMFHQNKTALDLAILGKHRECVEYLLSQKAKQSSTNEQDKDNIFKNEVAPLLPERKNDTFFFRNKGKITVFVGGTVSAALIVAGSVYVSNRH